jgi:hypothetical protein
VTGTQNQSLFTQNCVNCKIYPGNKYKYILKIKPIIMTTSHTPANVKIVLLSGTFSPQQLMQNHTIASIE